MAKVMLVEDDNNLREIYEARLAAEGYEIVSAHDGEEALALAVKERPDLIISDVMMPKISGFDMLDILRGTPETRNTKVIMMTALSQAEDRTRADKLGADRYLVKSQVTLEDVVKVAQEVLSDTSNAAIDSATPAPVTPSVDADQAGPAPVVAAPPAPAAAPQTPEPPVATPDPVEPVPAPEPAAPVEPPKPPEEPTIVPPPEPVPAPTTSIPVVMATPEPTENPADPIVTEAKNDDIANAPAAPFEAPAPSAPVTSAPQPAVPTAPSTVDAAHAQTEAEETEGVEQQIQEFVTNNPTLSSAADAPNPPAEAKSIPVIEIPEKDETPRPVESHLPTNVVPDSAPENAPMAGVKPHDNPTHKKLIIQPTGNATKTIVDLEALLAKEEGGEGIMPPQTNSVIAPTDPTDDGTPKLDPSQIAL